MILNFFNPKISCLFLILFSLLAFSCDEKEDDPEEMAEVTGILGTWNLVKTECTASFMGVTQDDTDENPDGTVVFVSGGIGGGYFTTNLFGLPYASSGDFTYVRDGDKITVTESDGEVRIWTINSLSNDKMIVSYIDLIDSGATADFTLTLNKS